MEGGVRERTLTMASAKGCLHTLVKVPSLGDSGGSGTAREHLALQAFGTGLLPFPPPPPKKEMMRRWLQEMFVSPQRTSPGGGRHAS